MQNVHVRDRNTAFTQIQGVSQCTLGLQKFIMGKTVGHVFTKHVQIEGTTQKIFSPGSCFSL